MAKLVRSIAWCAVFAAAIIGAARLTVIRWWRVPHDDPMLGASIAPTLSPGDLVLLWRGTKPRFGSLVLCPDPEDTAYSIVARLVGEEGDKIVIDGDDVAVNDVRAATETACDPFTIEDPNTGASVEQLCDVEALGGVSHARGKVRSDHPASQRTEREVGEGKVYLLSDNRFFPFDSRQYGAVDRGTCKETVFFRLVSSKGFADSKSRFTLIR